MSAPTGPTKPAILPVGRPRAILFDLDGTLVDSLRDLASALNTMLEELGRPTWPAETIASWVGQGAERLVARGLTGGADHAPVDLLEHALQRFRAIYLEGCCMATTPLPFADAALATLHEWGLPLAVVTNKPIAPTRRILDTLGWSRLVSVTIGGDSLSTKKPSAEPVLAAAAALRLAVSPHLWLVGDSETDLRTAEAAGIVGVGVRGGYNYGRPLDESSVGAWRIVDDLREVVELVRVAGK